MTSEAASVGGLFSSLEHFPRSYRASPSRLASAYLCAVAVRLGERRKKAAEIVSGLSGKNTCLNEIVAPAPDAASTMAEG
jgi:hypothetical protein